jgi:predicted MPP superfamily phosphohydrolase
MPDDINSLIWLTDIHLEFFSHRTRHDLYRSINQAAGEIVVITGDLPAGTHRSAQYSDLADQHFQKRHGVGFGRPHKVASNLTTPEAGCMIGQNNEPK